MGIFVINLKLLHCMYVPSVEVAISKLMIKLLLANNNKNLANVCFCVLKLAVLLKIISFSDKALVCRFILILMYADTYITHKLYTSEVSRLFYYIWCCRYLEVNLKSRVFYLVLWLTKMSLIQGWEGTTLFWHLCYLAWNNQVCLFLSYK